VDHSAIAVARGRGQPDPPRNLEFEEADAFAALAATASSSADIVYAHAVYMMLSESEEDRLAREVFRVLRPGGLPLFAVRSTADPHFGQGREVSPDRWVRDPDPEPMHYYRPEALGRLGAPGFLRQAEAPSADGHLWYVSDRRP
ncbi:MAG: class I SAM-dependent methyltransferase, partial [Thermoplasmata archaeon]